MSLGSKITMLREKNNLTQQELAEKLNYTPQAISKWENGTSEPKLDTLRDIANVFGISLSELLADENEKSGCSENGKKSNMIIYDIANDEVVNKNKFKVLSFIYSFIFYLVYCALLYDDKSNMIIILIIGVFISLFFGNYYYKVNVYKKMKEKIFIYQCNIYFLSNCINKTNSLFIFLFKIPLLIIDLLIYLLKIIYLMFVALFVWGDTYE